MFVVYNLNTTVVREHYKMYHHAAAFAAKLNAREGKKLFEAVHRDFHEGYVVYERTVRNAMSGKSTTERSDTPWSCSVASEHYWAS
jgi:hypothetical protein